MNTHKVLLFLLILSTCLLLHNCSVQEVLVENDLLISEPRIAPLSDSTRVNTAKSFIQSSYEYLLSGFTSFENGVFSVKITPEELSELGIPQSAYLSYCENLSRINRK